MEVFRSETTEIEILEYLENPYEIIIKKYAECYENSWSNLEMNYSTERMSRDLLKEFYELINRF
jgi:hypothetical protein